MLRRREYPGTLVSIKSNKQISRAEPQSVKACESLLIITLDADLWPSAALKGCCFRKFFSPGLTSLLGGAGYCISHPLYTTKVPNLCLPLNLLIQIQRNWKWGNPLPNKVKQQIFVRTNHLEPRQSLIPIHPLAPTAPRPWCLVWLLAPGPTPRHRSSATRGCRDALGPRRWPLESTSSPGAAWQLQATTTTTTTSVIHIVNGAAVDVKS